jgi:hypothetical protein
MIGRERKIITSKGAYFYFGEQKIAQGEIASMKVLEEDLGLQQAIRAAILGVQP